MGKCDVTILLAELIPYQYSDWHMFRIHLNDSMKETHSQGWGRVRIYFKMIFSIEGHQQLTVSSPYRWWFCGLMSTLPLLPPAPPHCCCDLFSPSWFLLSCCPHHLESLGLNRQVLYAQEWHQESISPLFSFFLSPPLRACHSLQFGGNFVF